MGPDSDDDPRASAELRNLLERSRALGFLGPGPIDAHLAHAEPLVTLLAQLTSVEAAVTALDLGSGGGVPGLILAVAFPSWRWVLLDAMEKRTAFLLAAAAQLDGDRIQVVRARAEVVGRDPSFRSAMDVVTARSFGAPAVVAECAAPLLRQGGLLVVSEPPDADGERWQVEGLTLLGFDPTPVATGSWVAFRLERPTSTSYPRAVGRPGKRPLWRP